jgi:PilZ domain-containing protein
MDPKAEPTHDAAADAPDQRHLVRRRVLLGAKVVEANGAFSTDCTIRNVTDDGAGLRLPAPVPVGDRVYLIELRTGLAHQVKVAWRRNAEMGVEFEKEVVLQPTGDPLTRMLHRLWVGSGNR